MIMHRWPKAKLGPLRRSRRHRCRHYRRRQSRAQWVSQRWRRHTEGGGPIVSPPCPPFAWLAVLTEIYRCDICSCQEILRVDTVCQARTPPRRSSPQRSPQPSWCGHACTAQLLCSESGARACMAGVWGWRRARVNGGGAVDTTFDIIARRPNAPRSWSWSWSWPPRVSAGSPAEVRRLIDALCPLFASHGASIRRPALLQAARQRHPQRHLIDRPKCRRPRPRQRPSPSPSPSPS